jgi:hypothetical protein
VLEHLGGLGGALGHRLLAEHRQARLDRRQDQLRVRVRGRRDDHAVHALGEQVGGIRGRFGAVLRHDPVDRRRHRVRDDEFIDAVE